MQVSNLEELKLQIKKFCLNGNIRDKHFMVHILNNLPGEHDVILDGLKNCLAVRWENIWTIEVIGEKLDYW